MGRHSSSNLQLTGRLIQQPGKHVNGIGMIPLGDRERGDPRLDSSEERPNNDPHIHRF